MNAVRANHRIGDHGGAIGEGQPDAVAGLVQPNQFVVQLEVLVGDRTARTFARYFAVGEAFFRLPTAGSIRHLFRVVSGIERRNLPSIFESSRKKGVLTISDLPKFAEYGGNIGFIEQDGRIRFEINLESAQQARLRISSQLLKLGTIVRSGN